MKSEGVYELLQKTGQFCSEEIYGVYKLKAGMTNDSYRFSYLQKDYIIRIPGVGTEKLIDRRKEYDVYQKVQNYGFAEQICYFDKYSGVKVSVLYSDSRTCDKENNDDVLRCMKALREFHELELNVEHSFDLWERIEVQEGLWNGEESQYPDYHVVKKEVFLLREYIDQQPRKRVLCHIDAVPDNFLFVKQEKSFEEIRLIDWEYAGMQDPHLDIAMFAIYAMYDRTEIDKLIDAYFLEEDCSWSVRMKIYCYISVCGLLWSNWCEFKRKCGVEFGEYAQKQYAYAKEYLQIFKDSYRKEHGYEYI